MIKKVCENCKKEYYCKSYLKDKSRFCSAKCRTEFYSGKGKKPNRQRGEIVNCYTKVHQELRKNGPN